MKKRLQSTAVAATVMLLATACGASTSSDSTDGGKITIGIPGPAGVLLPAMFADQEALFEQEGIDVEVKVIAPQQLVTALAGGSIQFAALPAPSADTAALNGAPIKWYGQWAAHANAVVLTQADITSLDQLSEQTMAVSAPGTLQAMLLDTALKDAGVDPSTVKKQVVSDPTAPVQLFIQGTIEGFVSAEPTTGQVLAEVPDANKAADLSTYDWTGAGLAGNSEWVDAHKDETIAVLKGLNAGISMWKSDPEAAKALIAKAAGISDTNVVDAAYDASLAGAGGIADAVSPVSQETEQFVLETMRENGFPKADPENWADFVDSTLAVEAGS